MDHTNHHSPEETPESSNLFIGDTRMQKSLHLSKNLVILVLSGIFVALVIADLVVFLLPHHTDSANTNIVAPTANPSVTTSPTQVITTTTTKPSQKPTSTSTPIPVTSKPTDTPTITPTPRPPANTDTTYGVGEKVTCTEITGWAVDPDDTGSQVSVWLYANGGTYGGIMSGQVMTSSVREDINSSHHIVGNHGYSIPVIAPLKDGKEHSLYLYAETKDGTRHQLGNTPQYITCTP